MKTRDVFTNCWVCMSRTHVWTENGGTMERVEACRCPPPVEQKKRSDVPLLHACETCGAPCRTKYCVPCGKKAQNTRDRSVQKASMHPCLDCTALVGRKAKRCETHARLHNARSGRERHRQTTARRARFTA